MTTEAALAPVRTAVPAIDGMGFAFGGWSDDLGMSGLSAIIVTIDDYVSGYDVSMERMRRALATIERDDRLTLVRSVDDLLKAHEGGTFGMILGFQNSNPVDGDLNHLQEFYDLGLRSMQLTYNETNLAGSGCLAPVDEGLTGFGRELVSAMNELGILVDLSHTGERTTMDAVEASAKPVAFTHASFSALTPGPRNKSDEVVRAVAGTGGLIGISAYGPFCWDPATGERPTMQNVLAHVRHGIDLVGDEAIGFGGDWPVGVTPEVYSDAMKALAANAAPVIAEYNARVGESRDLRYPSGMPSLAHAWRIQSALAADGLPAVTVDRLKGGNFLRVLEKAWTASDSEAGSAER